MLRKFILLSTTSLTLISSSFASNRFDVNNSNLDSVEERDRQAQRVMVSVQAPLNANSWMDAPLVTEEHGQLKAHPTLGSLAHDISLANDLSYAIGKAHLASHFLDQRHLLPHVNLLDEVRLQKLLAQLQDAYKVHFEKMETLLSKLARHGWRPAVGGNNLNAESIQQSIIKGKSGSLAAGFVDNDSGVVLFHEKTGTLLSVFHGSRADDFLPQGFDWDANLDTDLADFLLNSAITIKAHRGFATTAQNLEPSLHRIIRDAFLPRGNAIKRVLFTGHSHGASVSALACLRAIGVLDPEMRKLYGNLPTNLFSHYGLSEPAPIHVDSHDRVLELVGKGNFLSPGALHDPAMLFFRGDFWSDFASVIDELVTPNRDRQQTIQFVIDALAEFMPSPKLKDILKLVADPERRLKFVHIGHRALEPYKDLLLRVGVDYMQKFMQSGSIDLKALVAVVHYGGSNVGTGNNFDHNLPAVLGKQIKGSQGIYLDQMLQVAQSRPMTIAVFMRDLKEIKDMAGMMVNEISLGIKECIVLVEALPLEQKVAVKAAGAVAAGAGAVRLAADTFDEMKKRDMGWLEFAIRGVGVVGMGLLSAVSAKSAIDDLSKDASKVPSAAKDENTGPRIEVLPDEDDVAKKPKQIEDKK
jgi:hypothetical protein